jgi:hypothetical protein
MIGANKKNTNRNTQTPAATKEPGKVSGTTYDLCRKVKQANGTEKLQRIGKVFIRASGTGGVVFLTDDDGTKYELPVFAKSRKGGPDAAPQADASAAA